MNNSIWDKICLTLLIIGGINWGLVGIFEFDLVAWLLGGSASVLSRAVYDVIIPLRRPRGFASDSFYRIVPENKPPFVKTGEFLV